MNGWIPDYRWGYEVRGQQFRKLTEFPFEQNGISKKELKRRARTKAASESYQRSLLMKGRAQL